MGGCVQVCLEASNELSSTHPHEMVRALWVIIQTVHNKVPMDDHFDTNRVGCARKT